MGKTIVSGGARATEPIALPPKGKTLNEYTWEEISNIAVKGKATEYFTVGDTKEVVLNGTVGKLALSNFSAYVYIIGFNHNGATNTIDFGTFKTSNGKDVCLIDSGYSTSTKRTSGEYFTMNHWGNYNYGGWKGCDLRYDILGSTDVAPSGYGVAVTTSRVGYDASETCAINPVADTLMAALPADLRAVMKPMTIYTDNLGNDNRSIIGITTSVDYLPLAAEFEIFGAQNRANECELLYQKQYEYYSAGNSTKKYRHSSASSTSYWWLRSPFYLSTNSFCDANNSGDSAYLDAAFSLGVSPIFRV